jgi:hypothetical protein
MFSLRIRLKYLKNQIILFALILKVIANVTRQTWRAPFHFDEYLFQSTRHFGECLKKMVSHTVNRYFLQTDVSYNNTKNQK